MRPRHDPGTGVSGAGMRRSESGEGAGAGRGRRVHSPRDIGKRNAEERAAGRGGLLCDLGDSLTTTGGFCLHSANTRSRRDSRRSLRNDLVLGHRTTDVEGGNNRNLNRNNAPSILNTKDERIIVTSARQTFKLPNNHFGFYILTYHQQRS